MGNQLTRIHVEKRPLNENSSSSSSSSRQSLPQVEMLLGQSISHFATTCLRRVVILFDRQIT